MVRGLMALMATLVLPSLVAAPEDHFIPPDLEQASMLACAIGGNADGTSDAIVFADYRNEIHTRWSVLYARRDSSTKAAEDCRVWFQDMKGELQRALDRKRGHK